MAGHSRQFQTAATPASLSKWTVGSLGCTGYRWENRIRPPKSEHFINPVLYFEYASKNSADEILKEVEGHDVQADFLTPNAQARKEHIHEMELKLILSITVKGWNFSENILAAKEPFK